MLEGLQAARLATFGVDDTVPDESLRTTDHAAWHFVVTDAAGQVAGAMRLFIVDRRIEPLAAQDIISFGHVSFPSVSIEAQHLIALEHLIDRMPDEPCYIYAGGFFTSSAWRGSGLGVALGVAAIAMARLYRSRFAASFASSRDRAPELFAMLGGRPLKRDDGEALAPFHCSRHGFAIQLLAFDSMRPAPVIEPALELMLDRLQGMTALTPLGERPEAAWPRGVTSVRERARAPGLTS